MTVRIVVGDAVERLREMPERSAQTCVTSPPYWSLRDYGVPGQLGLERTPEEYVERMVAVFRHVHRVLRDDGTLWLNLGDSYVGNASPGGEGSRTCHGRPNARDPIGITKRGSGLKPKDLCGIPWRVAFALQADGWYLRSDIIWAKPNPMPESVTDRPTKAHEYIFLLTKSARYFYDSAAISERVSEAGVVERAHLANQGGILADNTRLQIPATIAEISVHLASSILNRAQPKYDLGLTTLDAQIGQQGRQDLTGPLVSRVPVEGRAAELAARFADGDVAAKDFLREMYRLWVALPDSDQLKEAWGFALAHVTLVDSDGDRPVGVHDAGQVREINCAHTEQYSTRDTPSVAQFRNARSVWSVATQPYSGAHFATFPPKLIEPCILAGTSPQACEQCGAPWRRVVDVTPSVTQADRLAAQEREAAIAGVASHFGRDRGNSGKNLPRATREDRGLAPSCACEGTTGSARSVVLDPFGGAGTTGLVADRLGRDAVLIELNPQYAAMARDRITSDAPLFADVSGDAA